MRSIILLCFLFFFLDSLFAQENYEYVFQSRHGRVNAVAVSEGRLAAVGSEESCRSPLLAFFNPEGELQWTTTPYDCFFCKADDVEFTADGSLLVAGDWRSADDVGSLEDGLAVARFDSLGNRLGFTKMAYYPIFHPVSIVELPSGDIMAASENYLFGFNAQLDSLFTREFMLEEGEYFLDIALAGDSLIALLSQEQVMFIDTRGEMFIGVTTNNRPFKAMAAAPDSVFFLTSNSLDSYDWSDGSSSSTPLPPGTIQGVALEGQEILLWGRDLYRLDSQEGWQELFSPRLAQKTTNKMVYENGFFYRGGEDILEPSTSGYLNMQLGYVERVVPSAVYEKDIGVSKMEMLELVSKTITDSAPSYYSLTYTVRFSLEITNYGSTEASSFVLFSERLGGFNCGEARFSHTVNDAALAPGESMLVEGTLREYRSADNPNPNLNIERCFFTGAPDNQFDADFSNNSYCGTILVAVEEPEEAASLRLFPNPATEVLYIEPSTDMQAEAFEWLNAAGQRVGEGRLETNAILQLSRPGPPGLYWLRLMGREEVVCRPVVWR